MQNYAYKVAKMSINSKEYNHWVPNDMYQLLKGKKSIFGPPYHNPSNIINDITDFVIAQMIRIQIEMLQIFYDSDTLRYRIDTKKSQILYEMLQIHYKKCYRFGQSQTHCHTD